MQIKEFEENFRKYLNEIKMELSSEQINLFYIYMNELIEWNTKMNLTAIVEPKEIILKHFIDSLLIEKYIKDANTLIDIGTGAGFPGIPLKIYESKLQMTLLDSLNKRIDFLNNVIEKLQLAKIEAIHERAEYLGRNLKYRENFDIVTSRAVADLKILSEYMLPFVSIGGLCICMKGKELQEIDEAKEMINKLGGNIVAIDEYNLPLSDMKRTVVVIRKERLTSGEYPRRPNQIKK